MNTEEIGGLVLIFLLFLFGIFLGVVVGNSVTDKAWKKELITNKLYHWTIDAETGEENFEPITPIKDKE